MGHYASEMGSGDDRHEQRKRDNQNTLREVKKLQASLGFMAHVPDRFKDHLEDFKNWLAAQA